MSLQKLKNKILATPKNKLIAVAAAVVIIAVLTELIPALNIPELNIAEWQTIILVMLPAAYLENEFLKKYFFIIVFAAVILIILIIFYFKKKYPELKKWIKQDKKKELELIFKKTLELSKKDKEIHAKIKKAIASIKNKKDKKSVKHVLMIIDANFGKLPKIEIDAFAKSKEAEIYERILKKYGAG